MQKKRIVIDNRIEKCNVAGASHSIAIGEGNSVYGHHSIIIGRDLTTDENYKLVVHFDAENAGLMPELSINIEEKLTKREYRLISSALKATLYLQEQIHRQQ